MAIIGTIRKNGWILIVMMALALGGFILMDVVSNSQRYSAADLNTLGKVNGEQVKRDEFDTYEKLVYSNTKSNPYQIRTQVWNYFVEKALVSQEAEELGLGVGLDELKDLQFGNNLSPIMAERFKDQAGQVNRAQLASIKAAIEGGQFTDPTNRAYWAVQEKEVIKKRIEDKLMSLVTKGLYTPKWEAEMAFRDNNYRLDAAYVRIPFDKVPDSEVKLTDADYTAFLKNHPGMYDQTEETRVIDYVAIDVVPTQGDTSECREMVAKLMDGLRNAENDSIYAVSNNGVYDGSYKAKDALPPSMADDLLSLPLNTVVGPTLTNGVWVVAKIEGRMVVPDSVRARHILIQGANQASENRIDSLMGLLKSGAYRFDSLAVQNSQDGGSAQKGGDLGWFAAGMMVPEFNNVCFYQSEIGKYYKVATQFGWHLIEVTNKKFMTNSTGVKAAYLSQRVEPSANTQSIAKEKAEQIAQHAKTIDDLRKMASEQNLAVETSQPLKANDFSVGQLGAEETSRQIVRWVFDEKTNEGDVSKEVFTYRDAAGGYFDARYIVAVVKAVAPKGAATIATLKANPKADSEVKNAKKAEIIIGKLQNPNDFPALAEKYQVNVDTARGLSMLQTFLQNGGSEPIVIGTLFGMAKDQVTKPIAGTSGVYVAKAITEQSKPGLPADLTLFRKQVTSSASTGIRMGLLTSMKKAAEVDDNRSRFF
ncbi:MAG: peptidylprolyl isomerase [Lewinellaceae bacterium]|nr:peptidylprolyl isomerase [Lewinellaceae bacterium]